MPLTEEQKRERIANATSAWSFTAVCCVYFVLAGWAAYRTVPIIATLFVGLGFSISFDSILFHLFLNYVWLIVGGFAGMISLLLARQFLHFSERYRRLVNLVLLIAAIGSAPMLLFAIAITFSSPIRVFGRLTS
jgi:hypothetical protein